MDCSMPGFPVHHQHLELAQTHVHRVGDAIHSFHPMSSPSLLPSIFPSIRVFSNELVLQIGGQRIEASASASVFPMNIQDWFPLGLTDLVSLLSKGLPRVFSSTAVHAIFFMVQVSYPYMTTGKTIALTVWTFVGKVMSLLFNTCLVLSQFFFQGAGIF